MNAFPPPRLVTRGVYALVRAPDLRRASARSASACRSRRAPRAASGSSHPRSCSARSRSSSVTSVTISTQRFGSARGAPLASAFLPRATICAVVRAAHLGARVRASFRGSLSARRRFTPKTLAPSASRSLAPFCRARTARSARVVLALAARDAARHSALTRSFRRSTPSLLAIGRARSRAERGRSRAPRSSWLGPALALAVAAGSRAGDQASRESLASVSRTPSWRTRARCGARCARSPSASRTRGTRRESVPCASSTTASGQLLASGGGILIIGTLVGPGHFGDARALARSAA